MKKSRGFTLIELLVVVSIISLLSSVILTALQGAREKAQVSKIVQDLKQMEIAFNLMRGDSNSWLDEDYIYTGIESGNAGTNPNVQEIIDATSYNTLANYLTEEADFTYPGISDYRYAYDNDTNHSSGNVFTSPCNSGINSGSGVNLVIFYDDGTAVDVSELFVELNNIFEPGESESYPDDSCGKIRMNGNDTVIFYMLDTEA